MPGALAWTTFGLLIFFSWKYPFYTAVAIILFDLFWLFRIVYLYLHLRVSFVKMRRFMKVNWLAELKDSHPEFRKLYHLVILPMYKEPYEVVHETFHKLARANYPKEKLFIVLATEERAGEEGSKAAKRIEEEFGRNFGKFLITSHPFGLPNEIPGKGSNESWAAREAKEKIIDPDGYNYEDVIVSVFDVDTQVEPEYFGRLAYVFLTSKNPQRSSFQPIPLFTNNVYEAPIFSRVISFFPTFWQMMQQSRFEQLSTFSSQSMPFKALTEVDFWDRHLVSEDALIFWRFYFHFNGDWRTEPLYYPVSMDANAAPSLWQTAKNIYKQQRRWAWGSENVPYMMTRFVGNKAISFWEKLSWSFVFIEGFWSWATASFILFLGGWLPLWLGGQEFSRTILSFSLPKITSYIMTFAILGIATSAVLSSVLLPPKPQWFRWYHSFLYILEWALTPIILIFFSAIPAVEAQTRLMLGGRFKLDFWATPKARKSKETKTLAKEDGVL